MDTTTKATELVSDIKEFGKKFNTEVYVDKLLEFAEEYHQKKCRKLPKEILVQNLERRGNKIAHDNNIFKRKNWDQAVQVITENYK